MKKSISYHIAYDFISKFTKTIAISRYSPKASTLTKKCSQIYPLETSGHYAVKTADLIQASKDLGYLVKAIPGTDDVQIGLSAEEFHRARHRSAYSADLICVHGFAPYTFENSDTSDKPIQKPCCRSCSGGFEIPSEIEIESAKRWLIRPHSPPPTKLEKMQNKITGTSDSKPGLGAIILAARALGFHTSMGVNGEPQITRPQLSPVAQSKKQGAV